MQTKLEDLLTDEVDTELATRGLRKARFDPETNKFEDGSKTVRLEDGTEILVVSL